jgi:2-dehydropantoate 2-reductase
VTVAVLGPGGVGGLVAGALDRAGTPVIVLARDSTAEAIATKGLRVSSALLGDFVAHPRTATTLDEPVDALIVATKATGLRDALGRVGAAPKLVLPLLNGLDHIAVLRERFGDGAVVAGTIRVEADRREPGVVVHTSQFLRVDMASDDPAARAPMEQLASTLSDAGIPARVGRPTTGDAADRSEAQVMWSKLVRLNALACTTSAFDCLLGEIRSTPELRAELIGAIEEGCAVAQAEGARRAHRRPRHARQFDAARHRRRAAAGAGRYRRLGAARRRTSRDRVSHDRTARRDDRSASRRATPGNPLTGSTAQSSRGETSGEMTGSARVATASTTSSSDSTAPSSCSPSHSTRKLALWPPSAWIVIPGRISSPSSKPKRSMSKCARPIPHAVCVGFSRS